MHVCLPVQATCTPPLLQLAVPPVHIQAGHNYYVMNVCNRWLQGANGALDTMFGETALLWPAQ
jgi:hypothetical protein